MHNERDTRGCAISVADLVARVDLVFRAHGCSAEVAQTLAENCVYAERDGAMTHGLFRLPGYVATLKAGSVDGAAEPEIEDVAPGFVRVDARSGFAQAALARVRPLLLKKAKDHGIVLLAMRNSCHFGALSLDVEPFAESGLVALSLLNSFRSVVPHGATREVYGTNPIAFAAPRSGSFPLVFDLATSTVANGEVALAHLEGRELPTGAGVDASGRITSHPEEILEGGSLLTFGGHKGSSISMMVEILCAALVGSRFSFEVDIPDKSGGQIPKTGQAMIVLDPMKGINAGYSFALRVEELLTQLVQAGQSRIPGDRRRIARQRHEANGIWLSPQAQAMLVQLSS
jgi:delta1-piperideine-2-carboxylate reductase